MSSEVVKLAQRTSDFIDAFKKEGAGAKLGKVDVVNSPWHGGYQNPSLQKSFATLHLEKFTGKGQILEGCGVWEYKVPSAELPEGTPLKRDGNDMVIMETTDKRRIPRKYKDSANYTVSFDKMKEKFGDNFHNVYYNLQDGLAIAAQPENVRKKSFNRFVESQVKTVKEMFANEPVEWQEGLTSALTAQLVSDYNSGEYLNYAEDVIGQFPGGVALEGKKKEHIKESLQNKREKAGLTDPAINIAMGGSAKNAKFEKDAGIFVVEFPNQNTKQTSVGQALRENVDDIIDYTENLIGSPESKSGQKLFVSKDILDVAEDKNKVVLLYKGLSSENEGEVEAAIKRACRDCIEENTDLRENVDFTFSDVTPALTSQVQNATERYAKETGTWMSPKSLNRPIKLNENLLSQPSEEKTNNGPEF